MGLRAYVGALRGRYGHASAKARRDDVRLRAVARLLQGKRLEVEGKGGLVIYMGETSPSDPRRERYWYEHPGGRTYKMTPSEVVDAVMRHVGVEAIDHAKVHGS